MLFGSNSKSGYNLKILFQTKLLVCQYLCFGNQHISQYRPPDLVFDHSQYYYFEVRYKHTFMASIRHSISFFRKIKAHFKNLEQNLNNTSDHNQSENIRLKKEVRKKEDVGLRAGKPQVVSVH